MSRTPPRRSVTQAGDVLGIDASLNGTGLWFLREDYGTKLDPEKRTGIDRLARLYELLRNRLLERPVSTVVIEGYAFGSKSRAHAIGEWGGIVKLAIMELTIATRIIVIPPATLKKYTIGHCRAGESGKPEMRAAVRDRWGRDIADNDICDAYCLARAGWAIVNNIGCSEVDLATLKMAHITTVSR